MFLLYDSSSIAIFKAMYLMFLLYFHVPKSIAKMFIGQEAEGPCHREKGVYLYYIIL